MNIPFLSFPNFENKGNKLSYHDTLFFIGSCFSDSMGDLMHENNLKVKSNPFGVIFNSVSIFDSLNKIYTQSLFTKSDLVLNNELYTSWNIGSNMSSVNQNQLVDLLNNRLKESYEFLKTADKIIITLGTSYVYELIETKEIVANCHKFPSNLFSKKLLTVDENYQAIQDMVSLIEKHTPDTQIIFTVSPIRHIKDGISENTVSKSNIFSALNAVLKYNSKVSYYPSYEILIDCLRDYRFYKRDLVHPSSLAIDLIFEHFSQSIFDSKGLEYLADMKKLNTAKNHNLFYPKTELGKSFISKQLNEISLLEKKYPEMSFSRYLDYFQSLEK